MTHEFRQVDVFSRRRRCAATRSPSCTTPTASPTTQMARSPGGPTCSETTFLLRADRARRPTTGCGSSRPAASCRSPATRPSVSAHAWLEAGGEPRVGDEVVQECGAGLVRLRRAPRLAFAAPPLLPVRPGRPDATAAADRPRRCGSTSTTSSTPQWIDNGPGLGGRCCCATPRPCWRCEPDWAAFGDLELGVVGPLRRPVGRAPSRCARSARDWASPRTR